MDETRTGDCALVVEDQEVVRKMVQEILQECGYPTTGVANGAEALNYLRSSAPPCVILLDLMMPVMNGWEFRREQLQDDALASIPVVVLSGAGLQPEEAANLGVDRYLPKPVDLRLLLDVVGQYCPHVAESAS